MISKCHYLGRFNTSSSLVLGGTTKHSSTRTFALHPNQLVVSRGFSSLPTAAQIDQDEQPVPAGVKKLKIKYSFEGDPSLHPRVFKTRINADQDTLAVSELYDLLVEDRVNLRTVAGLRYYKPKDDGFVNVLGESINLNKAVKDDTLELQLEKSKSRALMIGPIISFDPNFGLFFDRLNPIINTTFLAVGQLFKRKYQMDLTTAGIKFDLSVRSQFIFFFRAPFKQMYYHEPIKLGRGLDVQWVFHLTWCSFAETSGGVLMVGIPIGLAAGISLVTGGQLNPVNSEVREDNWPTPSVHMEQVKVPKTVEGQQSTEPQPVQKANPVTDNVQ